MNKNDHLFCEHARDGKTTLQLYEELLSSYDVEYVCNKLSLHRGTIKRWNQQGKVPDSYFADFNYLLGNKYPLPKHLDNERGKDQFYTTKKISQYCFNKLKETMKMLKINEKKYTFIEPSAGCCNFYDLLPKDRRIGVDIEPKGNKELIKGNYLDYSPMNSGNYIVVGNPPFGLRGNLALRFIQHSYAFADVVCFILPPLFNSDGKGSPKKRIKGYKLAHSEDLPLDSFEYPSGKSVKIATLLQIWTKINTELIKIEEKKTCTTFMKVYSLSDGGTPSSTRNKNMLDKCDVYLPSTCFKNMKAFDSFDQLPHRRGYGVVFKTEKRKLKKIFLKDILWEEVAFLATNSSLNLRASLIENELIKRGFIDEEK